MAVVLVHQAKAIVRQWVVEHASHQAWFRGAFYHGSINWLSDQARLPDTSDIDVMVVVEDRNLPEKLGKILYQGVIIEVTYLPSDQVLSADQVLPVSYLAGSLRGESIILDPSGHLSEIQTVVSKEYAKRKWVIRRCEQVMRKVETYLQAVEEAKLFHDQAMAWLFGTGVTTYILLVAGLENPTVRKRYLAARELLAAYGRSDFYETLLEMLGCARISRERTEQHLVGLEAAFDAARMVIQSPVPFAADISDLARPVAIDGSRELIESGNHREAIFWMAVTYSRCMKVLYLDGQAGAFTRFEPGYRSLHASLGIRTGSDLIKRSRQVKQIVPRIWEVAETIIQKNPAIT